MSSLYKTTIPKGWKEVIFGDLIMENQKSKIKAGEANDNCKYKFFTSGVKVLTHDDFLVDKENIFLSTGGRALVKYFKGRSSYSADTYSIKTNKKISTKYFYYSVLLKIDYIDKNLFIGSGLKHLQKNDFKKLKLLIPPLSEQNKIVEILSTVDEGIEKTDQIIKETEKLKRGLMQNFFSEKLKIKSEKLNNYVLHVGSGATPRGGSKAYSKFGIPFVRSQNIYFDGLKKDGLVYISEEIHNLMQRSFVYPNDILLNITGASLGRACVAPNIFPIANVNQHVCIIRPQKKLFYKYLFYFLQSNVGQKQIFKFQAGGNREGLNFQQIRSFNLPILKIKQQKQIAEILSSVDNKIDINKQIKTKLALLKKGLMQDLLSGRVRIK